LDVAAFHHYNTKSYGEFVKKGQRGRTTDGMSRMVNGTVPVAAAAGDRMSYLSSSLKMHWRKTAPVSLVWQKQMSYLMIQLGHC
jgi:hypothetical protein